MEIVLAIVGIASFVGYLIWLIVRIVQYDSKIPPIIGMFLSLVMLFGGIYSMQWFQDIIPSKTTTTPKTVDSPKADAASKGDFLSEAELKEMYSNPNKYKNRSVELIGEVFSSPEYDYDKDAVYFQMITDIGNSETNTIVKYQGDIELKDGDFLRLQGTVFGEYEGQNAFGAILTGPQIVAESLEIISYQDAVSPTLQTIIPNEPTQIQFGYSVTIEKVELAKDETRVYIKVENGGNSKFSLYTSSSTIIQNGKQYDEQYNYDADYPNVQTDLNVGISTEGIVSYPAIENADFQVVFEAHSDDYDEKIETFKFDCVA